MNKVVASAEEAIQDVLTGPPSWWVASIMRDTRESDPRPGAQRHKNLTTISNNAGRGRFSVWGALGQWPDLAAYRKLRGENKLLEQMV